MMTVKHIFLKGRLKANTETDFTRFGELGVPVFFVPDDVNCVKDSWVNLVEASTFLFKSLYICLDFDTRVLWKFGILFHNGSRMDKRGSDLIESV